MANLAAILPAARSPFEIHETEKYQPRSGELLIKNESLALNPLECKVAKMAIMPLQYPAIIGSTFAGVVSSVGPDVDGFQTGDRVVVSKRFGSQGNSYGAYQQFVLCPAVHSIVSKIPDGIGMDVPASLIMNLSCVVGLFSGRLGLAAPEVNNNSIPSTREEKILIYGGSSSFGGLSSQYLVQGGYTVVTTSSPKNKPFVEKLGTQRIVDHTLEPDRIVEQLVAEGPYDLVIDTISVPPTISITSSVLAAQGGGKLYAMQPSFGPESLPNGVERVFEPWSEPLYEEQNQPLLDWLNKTYLPQGLLNGKITPLPVDTMKGGLEAVDNALGRLMGGISGTKLVVHPFEQSI